MRCPARPACPSSPTTGSQGGRWSGPKLEPPKPTAVPADGKRSPWSLCTLAYRAFPARSASPTPAHHVRGIGDTASRCRIGHLPFPVHSRRLRWTLSGLRRGRAAYLTGLTTMTSCFSRGPGGPHSCVKALTTSRLRHVPRVHKTATSRETPICVQLGPKKYRFFPRRYRS